MFSYLMAIYSTYSILLQLVALFSLQDAFFTLILGFTSPNSIIRLVVFPPLVYFHWLLIPTYLPLVSTSVFAGFLAGYSVVTLLGYVEKALLRKWRFEAQGPSSTKVQDISKRGTENSGSKTKNEERRKDSIWERLDFGYCTTKYYRYINTPHVAKNTPSFSTKNPYYIPSRPVFLLRIVPISLLSYLVLDFMAQGGQPEMNHILYSARKVPFLTRIGEVSGEEIATRALTVIGYWIGAYLMIRLCHDISAFLYVACFIDKPEDRRPMFGAPSEAYTVRRYWR